MANWITSDHHFQHERIIEFQRRPFSSVGQMNEIMVQRWNEVVAPDDTVYYLGDFAMGDRAKQSLIIGRLTGQKVLVRGNHDRSRANMLQLGFDEVLDDNVVVDIDGLQCWLNHYPPESFGAHTTYVRPHAPGEYDLALHGHVHSLWKVKNGYVNVSVEVWDYYPTSIPKVLAALAIGDH